MTEPTTTVSEWGLLKQNPPFRRLFYATFISSLGDWFNSIAVVIVVLSLTHSSIAVGVTLAMRVLPYLIAGPIGGVWSDRMRRTRVMIASDLCRAVVALCFLLVTTVERVWWVYLLTGLLVVFSAFFTPARSAYLSSLVERESLGTANALMTGANGLVMILGYGVGGLVIAQWSVTIAFLLNAITFVISALLLVPGSRVEPQRERNASEKPGFWSEFGAGLRAIWQTRRVATVFLLVIGWPLGGGAVNVLIPVLADQGFHLGDAGLGMFYASLGLGTVIGSFVTSKWFKGQIHKMQGAIGVYYFADACFQVLFFYSPWAWLSSIALVGAGLAGAVGNSLLLTLIAAHTPSDLQGRVFSVAGTLSSSLLGLSMMLAGFLTVPLGPRLLGASGALVILLFTVCYIVRARQLK